MRSIVLKFRPWNDRLKLRKFLPRCNAPSAALQWLTGLPAFGWPGFPAEVSTIIIDVFDHKAVFGAIRGRLCSLGDAGFTCPAFLNLLKISFLAAAITTILKGSFTISKNPAPALIQISSRLLPASFVHWYKSLPSVLPPPPATLPGSATIMPRRRFPDGSSFALLRTRERCAEN